MDGHGRTQVKTRSVYEIHLLSRTSEHPILLPTILILPTRTRIRNRVVLVARGIFVALRAGILEVSGRQIRVRAVRLHRGTVRRRRNRIDRGIAARCAGITRAGVGGGRARVAGYRSGSGRRIAGGRTRVAGTSRGGGGGGGSIGCYVRVRGGDRRGRKGVAVRGSAGEAYVSPYGSRGDRQGVATCGTGVKGRNAGVRGSRGYRESVTGGARG